LTITALRRVTQRFVSGGGNSIALDAISPPNKGYSFVFSFMDALQLKGVTYTGNVREQLNKRKILKD